MVIGNSPTPVPGPRQPDPRASHQEVMAALGYLHEKVDDNTAALGELTDRMGAVEAFMYEWRGGLRVGCWVVGTVLGIGLVTAAFLGIPLTR